jgi:hypothetical protein
MFTSAKAFSKKLLNKYFNVVIFIHQSKLKLTQHNRSYTKFIAFSILLLFFCTACDSVSEKETTEEKTIASIGTEELKESDFKQQLIFASNKEDSAAFAQKTIENWALESLLYQEALTKLEPDEMDVEKQVNDYKKQLVNYIYETKLIENNLDTLVSAEEIEDYYNTHIDNFILKDNIVKVNYFKIPIQSKEINKIKKLLNATEKKEREQLEVLCTQHAESFFINDSVWLLLDDIKREIPKLKDQLEYNAMKGRVIEQGDTEAYYYLKIKDVKIKNSVSPLSFEKSNIKTFIINSRKIKLIQTYKQQLLEKARTDKTFKIF